MIRRLRTELRDLLELVLLPGLSAVLPWNWSFFIFKRLARLRWLYQEQCEIALQQARSRGWAGEDEPHWLWARRLITLVDHADHYLCLWRTDAWMQKYLTVDGKWPTTGEAVLLLSFHWGAGFWGLRHAAAHGLKPHALVASLDSHAYQGRTILGWYARSRNAQVARTLAAPTIDVSQQLRQVIRAIRDKQPILGVVDVPADGTNSTITISLLGMQARVPRGLLRIAVDQRVPVIVYITGLDTATGHRALRIKRLGAAETVENLASDVFTQLEKIIAEDSPSWHFWSVSDRFFLK